MRTANDTNGGRDRGAEMRWTNHGDGEHESGCGSYWILGNGYDRFTSYDVNGKGLQANVRTLREAKAAAKAHADTRRRAAAAVRAARAIGRTNSVARLYGRDVLDGRA